MTRLEIAWFTGRTIEEHEELAELPGENPLVEEMDISNSRMELEDEQQEDE